MRYPDAVWDPLGSQTQPRMKVHDIVCLHTMVGYLYSTNNMFHNNGYGGTESHFGIGGKWGSDVTGGRSWDGRVEQWQDLDYTADANLDGNHRCISIETADNAPTYAANIEPWTPKQVSAIVRLVRWLCSPGAHADCPSSWKCHQEGIPLKLIPDTKPGRRGIGYHAQGIAPNRVSGGELWSNANGKECPGPVRIRQLKSEIIPALTEEDMPLTDADLDKVEARVITALRKNIAFNRNGPTPDVQTISVADFLEMGDQKLDDIRSAVNTILPRDDEILVVLRTVADAVSRIPTNDAAVTEATAQILSAVSEVIIRIQSLRFQISE